jgi:hypothetical protein
VAALLVEYKCRVYSSQDIFDNHTDSFAVISVLTVGDLLQLNTAVFKTLQFGYEALADYLYGRTSLSCMNRQT